MMVLAHRPERLGWVTVCLVSNRLPTSFRINVPVFLLSSQNLTLLGIGCNVFSYPSALVACEPLQGEG